MLKNATRGTALIRIGLLIFAIALLLARGLNIDNAITAFLLGLGCALSLVGAGKRFFELRSTRSAP